MSYFIDYFMKKKREQVVTQKAKYDAAKQNYHEYDHAGKQKVDEFGARLKALTHEVNSLDEILDYASHLFDQYGKNQVDIIHSKRVRQKMIDLEATGIGVMLEDEQPIMILKSQVKAIKALLELHKEKRSGVVLEDYRADQVLKLVEFAEGQTGKTQHLEEICAWVKEDIEYQKSLS